MRRTIVTGLVAVALASIEAAPASGASEAPPARVQSIVVGDAPDGRGFSVEAVGQVDAPASAVVRALADVASFPLWAPKIKAIGNVEAQPEEALRFESTLGLPWPVGDVHEVILAQREEEPDGSTRLRWDHLSGDMRRNVAVWTITPVDAGHTRVRYEARLWFRSWLPPFLVKIAERNYTPWFLFCLERRANLLASPPAPPPPPATPSPS
jgi:uncharacterized protein YndB with AHSA1/START domain